MAQELQPSAAPRKKLARNFEWKGERECAKKRAARELLEADRERRGETEEETTRMMKWRMEREHSRMDKVNKKNESITEMLEEQQLLMKQTAKLKSPKIFC